MARLRYRKSAAVKHLAQCEYLGPVVKTVGSLKLRAGDEIPFQYLARAIIYQQLSGKAASTIHRRFVALFDNDEPTPERVIRIRATTLRKAGVSQQKQGYLKDLARRTVNGELALDKIDDKTDDEVIAELTQVKGIGRWSAQMFLMFRLGRADILAETDLGIRKGIQKVMGMAEMPSPREVTQLGERWAPYRSAASWYLWRSLDIELPTVR